MNASSARRAFATSASRRGPASARWLVYYYIVQIVCQLALLANVLAPARVLFRSSAFGMSLVALAFTLNRKTAMRHPATPYAFAVFFLIAAESFHPETSGAIAALATLAMYVAIIGPLLWVQRLAIDLRTFRNLVTLLWAFQATSAAVGALQVYFPGSFQPAVSTVLSESYLSGLRITLANGMEIYRPSGLTDAPGGAAAAGTYTILLGLGLWSDRPSRYFRLLLGASFVIGMFVLYLCQIRSLVVMVFLACVVSGFAHALRGRGRGALNVLLTTGTLAVVSFVAAVAVGGDGVVRRLSSLTNSNPTELYYTNRGIFLEQTLTELLPKYPLGAGLGRWGMVSSYFGGNVSDAIYVEIQWTGWLLDGGVLLVILYAFMLAVTVWTTWSLGRSRAGMAPAINAWAATLLGYDIGTLALTFNFPVFVSSLGLDFWLLNAAFFTLATQPTPLTSSTPTKG